MIGPPNHSVFIVLCELHRCRGQLCDGVNLFVYLQVTSCFAG